MDWRRFKNIIIIVLIIINIFFCAFLVRIKISDGRVDKKTKNNVISVLEKGNIVMETEDFPKNRNEYSACYITRVLPKDEKFVKKVIGEDGAYSQKNEVMTFKLSPKGEQALNEKAVLKTCHGFMNDKGIAFDLYKEESVKISSKAAKVKFRLSYDGEKFFDSYIEFSLNNKGIYKVKGKNFVKAEENISSYDAKLQKFESVIVAAAKDKKVKEKVEVEKIDFGYYLGNSADVYVSVLALPVWEIEFSDGDTLYYDARNGNLIYM